MAEGLHPTFPGTKPDERLQEFGTFGIAATDEPDQIVDERVGEARTGAGQEVATVGQAILKPAELGSQLRQSRGHVSG
jgi:hypothetical protein